MPHFCWLLYRGPLYERSNRPDDWVSFPDSMMRSQATTMMAKDCCSVQALRACHDNPGAPGTGGRSPGETPSRERRGPAFLVPVLFEDCSAFFEASPAIIAGFHIHFPYFIIISLFFIYRLSLFNPVCLKMSIRVPLARVSCSGTTVLHTMSSVTFCKDTWLPFCLITLKPCFSRS
jgi:hypothetical protein